MKFGSDNWAGVSDKISTALHDAREGYAPGWEDAEGLPKIGRKQSNLPKAGY